MFDSFTIAILVGIFIIAGTVKGIIGLGLPTISLALLTMALDLPSAMALMIIPSLVTNIWQAVVGGSFKHTLAQIWPFLLVAACTVWMGALFLTRVNLSLLSALLGGLLVVYSGLNLAGLKFSIKTKHEFIIGGIAGFVNGVLTGMTGSFVVPGVMYLQAIKLKRNALIQAMGMLFTVSTLALGISLQQNGFLSINHSLLSSLCLIPAIAGMGLGQRIRTRLSEKTFGKVFFTSLLFLGLYILSNQFSTYLKGFT